MSSVVISGNTSGTITLDAPAVAGTTTLTLPATSGTVLASGTAVTVAQGGTGASTLTANNVILGNGTSAVQFVAPGSNGNILTSNGTTWTSAAPSGGVTSLNGQTGAITNTTFGNIGSYYIGWGADATAYSTGSTIAGSSLLYLSSNSYGAMSHIASTANNSTSTFTVQNNVAKTNAGLSGTWRCMTFGGLAPASTFSQNHLWVRIS
jgi:hypothetical protein